MSYGNAATVPYGGVPATIPVVDAITPSSNGGVVEVVIPDGIAEGFPFQVITPYGPMLVTCPPGIKGGQSLLVSVPVTVVTATPVQLATPVSNTMSRDDGRVMGTAMIPDYDLAEATEFQKSLVGFWKAAPVSVWPVTILSEYTIAEGGSETFKMDGLTKVLICRCIPVDKVATSGEWKSSDISYTYRSSDGSVQTDTLTAYDRRRQQVEMSMSGYTPKGPIAGTSVSTTSVHTMNFTSHGGHSFKMAYTKQPGLRK
jgi:hypothetical protein